MDPSWHRFCLPTVVFLGLVAGFAEPGAVFQAGGSTVVPWNHMVEVSKGRVAVRCAAGVVAGFDESSEPRREEPCFGVHGQQFAAGGCGVEPAEQDFELLAG
jgi:hypothetical protein